jgi:hypothetical protein
VKTDRLIKFFFDIFLLFDRIIVLLGQCTSQLEHAQHAVDFNEQWESALSIVHTSFDTYQKQLTEIHQEQTSLIHLDAIQVLTYQTLLFSF